MTELPVVFLDGPKAFRGRTCVRRIPSGQSGFGGGHERWRTERGLVLAAVPDDGDFLDLVLHHSEFDG